MNDCSPEIEAPVEIALQGAFHVPNPLTLVVRPMSFDRSNGPDREERGGVRVQAP